MPMFGVSISEFRRLLLEVIDANDAADSAAVRRSTAIANLVSVTAASKGRVVGTYLEDIIFAFYQT